MDQLLQFPKLHDARYPVHRIADQLEPYLRVIVEQFHPEKIILFGSQAYGNPTIDSDVDLLIVRPDASGKQGNMQIRRAFWDLEAKPTSFTLLSRTPAELQERIDQGSPIYREILEKGLVLYAA